MLFIASEFLPANEAEWMWKTQENALKTGLSDSQALL